MNAITKSTFAWLLKREYWEERRGFLWAQIVVAAVILAATILGIVAAEITRARMHIHIVGQSGHDLGSALHYGISSNLPGLVRALDGTMLSFAAIGGVVLAFVVFFYLLGALYDDRRDRSILFWKSLPVSDSATVTSKVIAAVVVAPIIAAVVTLAAFICALIIASVWFLAHGLNPLTLLWAHADPYGVWLHLLVMIPVNALWALPTVGWLLAWSALVRSKPFLWAVAIPVVAGLLNFWVGLLGVANIDNQFFWTHLVGRALLSVVPGSWVSTESMNLTRHGVSFVGRDELAAIGYPAMGHALTQPGMWIGVVVGIALTAAAIWFRRWRDEI